MLSKATEWPSCIRTPHNAKSEASVSTANGFDIFGKANTGSVTIALFKLSKATWHWGVQFQVSVFFTKSVMGRAISE
ncbi:UNVERIFIED_CONTAM: hypothetical protein Sangu_1009400 [Sesamum angustifolium]|uniref:Uncharacterized protein n=1 Tax=Sesamum angustifolium TaxID=2727405 RepID=A0AAW2PI33_9LAMI